jgi:hypothetical protein
MVCCEAKGTPPNTLTERDADSMSYSPIMISFQRQIEISKSRQSFQELR